MVVRKEQKISPGQDTLVLVVGIDEPYPSQVDRQHLADSLNASYDMETRQPKNEVRFHDDLTAAETELIGDAEYAIKLISAIPNTITDIPTLIDDSTRIVQDHLENVKNLTVTETHTYRY